MGDTSRSSRATKEIGDVCTQANIEADEEFKREASSIRKKAERQIITSLGKFHQRRTERLSIKLRKLQQTKSSRKDTARNVN